MERARKAETENSAAAGDGEEGLLLGEEVEVLGFFLVWVSSEIGENGCDGEEEERCGGGGGEEGSRGGG